MTSIPILSNPNAVGNPNLMSEARRSYNKVVHGHFSLLTRLRGLELMARAVNSAC